MHTLEAIKNRRSIRVFTHQEITKENLEKLIEAARLAPTARNEQSWEFIIITNQSTKQKITQITDPNGSFISNAAACIAVFCLDAKYYLEDGCAATENILIQASDLGIGSCWVAGDKKPYCNQIKQLLKVPDNYKLISIIALGYPKKNPDPIEKRAIKDIVHWEHFKR